MVEAVASLKAMGGSLFPILNCDSLDPACPINACLGNDSPAGDQFISVNVTPQGQASAIRIARF
jgi:3-oxoacyl-[acyl-carrier-protein] synthase II